MSECKTLSVAQWLSTRFSRGRPGFDITAGPPLKVLKVKGKLVLPLSLHVQMVRLSFFNGFYGFLRTINLRSRLTILLNLNSVGPTRYS